MDVLLAVLLMALATMLQSALISQVPLLQGTADLVLVVLMIWAGHAPPRAAWVWAVLGGLLVGLVSAQPWPVPLLAYLLCVALALFFHRWLWTLTFLATLLSVFVGTFLTQGLSWGVLQVQGVVIPAGVVLNRIMLPSLLLNLLLTVVLYGLVADLAAWLYAVELEV